MRLRPPPGLSEKVVWSLAANGWRCRAGPGGLSFRPVLAFRFTLLRESADGLSDGLRAEQHGADEYPDNRSSVGGLMGCLESPPIWGKYVGRGAMFWGAGGWHRAMVLVGLPLAAPIGLSPLHIPTLCGSKRVLVVSTEPGGGGGGLQILMASGCNADAQKRRHSLCGRGGGGSNTASERPREHIRKWCIAEPNRASCADLRSSADHSQTLTRSSHSWKALASGAPRLVTGEHGGCAAPH